MSTVQEKRRERKAKQKYKIQSCTAWKISGKPRRATIERVRDKVGGRWMGGGATFSHPHFVTQPRNSRQFFMANKFFVFVSRSATNRNRAEGQKEKLCDWDSPRKRK